MNLIEKALYRAINGKIIIDKPLFLKEFTKDNENLRGLVELFNKVQNPVKKKNINSDIQLIKYGLDGEENVAYELNNSYIPMICLHDIRLEHEGHIAQLDFIIITTKFIYVLETKKLSGDIEVNSDGDFIRIIKSENGKEIKREGIYSPITQNERHVKILHDVLYSAGLIKTMPIKSVVVIANPKTIVNKEKAPKEIQKNIIKHDQLVRFLKNEMEDVNNERFALEKILFDIAQFLIENNKPKTYDFISKYSITNNDINVDKTTLYNKTNNPDKCEALKEYRFQVSRKEGIKAYMVFTDKELLDLVELKPKDKEELLNIKGFGQKKVDKYGDEIIKILNL